MGKSNENKDKYIVSACLVGMECRYDGGHKENAHIKQLVGSGKAIPVCPEQMGGLSIPRPPAEISGGTGADVLAGRAKVINSEGKDVTDYFIKGALQVLKLARMVDCKKAILKEKSPSCGTEKIYDGSFKGKLRGGRGVTAAFLVQEGIEVVNENDC